MRKYFFIIISLTTSSWSSAKQVSHPLADKGLTKIEADGSYIYKTTQVARSQSSSIRLGAIKPFNISSADGAYTFSDMYGSQDIMALNYDYDWYPVTQWGKMGVQVGLGLMSSYGQGRFSSNSSEIAKETYTLYGLPLSLGFSYRFEYFSNQWLAPYVCAGGTYFAMVESRDDGKYKALGSSAFYMAGGMLLSVAAMDRETAIALNSEYGISNLWVDVQYRKVQGSKTDFDISSDFLSAGVLFDY